ncbi:MAG: hypothetical protein ACT4OO_13710 [Nitrospiraceae bacterium]
MNRREVVRAGRYLILAAAFISDPVFAWESDVHYGLTKWLALQAGFAEQEAEAVAKGTWDKDHGINDPVHLVWHYACLGSSDVHASKLVRDSHFPSFAKLPGKPKTRVVEAGGKAAVREARHEVEDIHGGQHEFDLEKFGAALHPLQDSWSHRGVPDTPVPLFCNSMLTWGHPEARGGYKSHNADLTYQWPDDTQQAAQATYQFMQTYLTNRGRSNAAKPWQALEKEVKEFGKLTTKLGKERWFARHGFKNMDFLQEINLEDGEQPSTYPAHLSRPLSKALPDSLKALSGRGVSPEVSKFFSDLFAAWMTEKDFMRFQARLQSMGAIKDSMAPKPTPFERFTSETAAAQLWIWRLRDHGLVNKLGHSRIGMEGGAAFDTLMSATMRPGALADFGSVEKALLPIGEGAPPYLIVLLSMEATGFGSSERIQTAPQYGALARLKNAPHDLLMVIASETNGKLGVDGLYWTIDH